MKNKKMRPVGMVLNESGGLRKVVTTLTKKRQKYNRPTKVGQRMNISIAGGRVIRTSFHEIQS